MHKKNPSLIQSSLDIISGNDDLLTEILLFLPTKSLLKFRLVSKRWRSLISAESFSLLHSLHHHRRHEPHHSFILGATTSQFFLCHPTIKKLVPFHFPFPYLKILQSCNGLMLLECGKFPRGRKDYYVFNPTTMQHKNLNLREDSGVLSLMYDPSKSLHYRVIRFRNRENLIRFSVYNSNTNKWTDGGESPHGPYKFWDNVFWNNRVYFVRHCGPSFCFSPEDKFLSLPASPRKHVKGNKSYVVESSGRLHYLSMFVNLNKIRLEVFEMVDDKWSDSKPFLSATIVFGGDGIMEINLLGMIREERLEDSMLLVHVPGKIMIYRFSDEACEVLVDFRSDYFYQEGRLQFGFKDAHPFIETLAPV